jgi:hypothetical protein
VPAPAGWYGDPFGHHVHRFWDGTGWTEQVGDDGVHGSSVTRRRRTRPLTRARIRTARRRLAVAALLVVGLLVLDLSVWHSDGVGVVGVVGWAAAFTVILEGERSGHRWAQIIGRRPPTPTRPGWPATTPDGHGLPAGRSARGTQRRRCSVPGRRAAPSWAKPWLAGA